VAVRHAQPLHVQGGLNGVWHALSLGTAHGGGDAGCMIDEICNNGVVEFAAAGLTGASVRVARALLSGGPQTAAALAEGLGLTTAAVRRHLDALVRDGHVHGAERAPYGPNAREIRRGRGRPARVYAITAIGRDALEVHTRHGGDYDLLARDAIAFIQEATGTDGVDRFAQRRSARMASAYATRVEQAGPSRADRVEALAEALSADGYAATITAVGAGGVQLCQHNCPVAHVAHDYPALCEAETKAFSELLGVNVTRLATIAGGGGVCTTHVPVGVSPMEQPEAARRHPVQEDLS
jgi:predicted ArsR family transcriptional regulator